MTTNIGIITQAEAEKINPAFVAAALTGSTHDLLMASEFDGFKRGDIVLLAEIDYSGENKPRVFKLCRVTSVKPGFDDDDIRVSDGAASWRASGVDAFVKVPK